MDPKPIVKALRFIYYFFFGFFIILFVFTYFIELLFTPPEKSIRDKIKQKGYELKFDSVSWKGVSIGYVHAGNDTARRIILVHGSPGGWNNYYKLLEDETLLKNYHLIVPDRYGYGLTGGVKGEPDLNIHAEYLHELCKPSEGHLKPIMIGHSMGGPIVIQSAINYSNDLEGVISVAGSFDASLEPNEWFRGLYKTFPLNIFFSRSLRASNDELFLHKTALRKMSSEWSKITCRITIIQGGEDNLVAPCNIDFAKEKLAGKNADFIYIPNEDHLIPFTDPTPIFTALKKMAN